MFLGLRRRGKQPQRVSPAICGEAVADFIDAVGGAIEAEALAADGLIGLAVHARRSNVHFAQVVSTSLLPPYVKLSGLVRQLPGKLTQVFVVARLPPQSNVELNATTPSNKSDYGELPTLHLGRGGEKSNSKNLG